MLNNILSAILKFFFWVIGLLAEIITAPVFNLVKALFPPLSDYHTAFATYTINYVLKGLAFAREIFLNVTGFPRPLFHLLINLYLARLTFHLLSIPVKFIINTIRMVRGSGGEMVN